MRRRKEELMNWRTGLFIAAGLLAIPTARAAEVRPGVPQLLDADPGVICAVPATFPVAGVPTRELFLGTASGVSAMWEGRPEGLLWPRAQLRGGEQRPSGVFLATNFGVLHSADGTYARFVSPALFSLVSPYGWAKDSDGLWNLSDSGGFSRTNLPIAPWRNVVGFAPSTNYLYGPNLLWVGSAAYFNYQPGIYQAVIVRGRSLPTYGLPDFWNVTAICGINGGFLMVYNGMLLRHLDSPDPNAPLFTDTGLTPGRYALRSLRYAPNDVDGVAYLGRTLWLNLGGPSPTSVVMAGAIRHVANDADRHALIVSTSAGVFAIPYTLG
jgi:hypothetical protein